MTKRIKASKITYRQGKRNLRKQRKEFVDLFKEDILKIYKDKTPNNLNNLLTKIKTLPIEQQNRLLESVLKFDSGANPKYTILDGVKQMIFNPIKTKKTLNYIITGEGEPKLFSSHRINPYNGLFGNDYKSLGKVSKPIENGFIDAMIYGNEMNTNIGKTSNPLDFGIEYDYIKQNYPTKNVQYITTEPNILENQKNIKPTIHYGAKGSFKTKMPGITINNQGIILEEGVRNDSTFVRGLDVYDFKAKDYVKKWLNGDIKFLPTIQYIDNITTPVAVKTPWVYKDNINDIIGNHSGFDFLNFDFNSIDSNKSIYKQNNGIQKYFKMGGKQKRIVPNVVRGGVAIPLGANYFLMKGKTHEQGGIDIGKDLEVENGELIRLDKNNMTIVSNAPIMNGISPAEYALGGLKDGTFVDRFKQGFKYQEKYKDINRLKDDGTKAKIGKEKTIDEMNSKMLYVPKKEPEVIINPPFLEGQVYKEIKDYIGGSPTQARKKAFNKMPRIKEKIIELANTYGIDKNLLAHRLTKEGWIDKRIQEYNKTGSLKQRDFWDKAILREVNAFEDLGLDDAATNLAKGNYNMRNELPFWTIDADNEKGRKVYSIVANSLFDALEFQAADMEYRKNELLKRGYPEENINTYINAAYNLGLYHKDLDDAEWINKTYAVPNYYELGGKANMKKNDRNVPSTGKKIKASFGIELNKVKNRIDIPENNRVIKITPEPKLLSPEPLKPTSEQKRNLAIAKTKDFIKNNIDGIGDFTNALVGVGSSIASNRINNKMLNGLEELPEITPFVPLGNTKLKTSYNIHPQLAKARKIANRLNRYVDRNTSSSQTAINRRRQNELDYLENFNTLYGQKENVENQLINQDRMLQYQIDQYNNQLANQDIARQDVRKAENIQLRNAIAEKKAENSVALADNISSIINNMIMNRKQGRANDKTLKVMAAGFPSITKDYLKELGLI